MKEEEEDGEREVMSIENKIGRQRARRRAIHHDTEPVSELGDHVRAACIVSSTLHRPAAVIS